MWLDVLLYTGLRRGDAVRLGSTIPIVFTIGVDPVQLGLFLSAESYGSYWQYSGHTAAGAQGLALTRSGNSWSQLLFRMPPQEGAESVGYVTPSKMFVPLI